MIVGKFNKLLFALLLLILNFHLAMAATPDDAKLQQLQAQLNALNNPSSSPSVSAALSDAKGNALANQILGQQANNTANGDVLAQITADQKRTNTSTVTTNTNPSMPSTSTTTTSTTTTSSALATPALATSNDDLNNIAYDNMVKNALPMSPAQIQKLRGAYMASQYAAASSPITPPRPTAVSLFVDLSPGATPPVIRLSQGFVTSLVFVDSSGAPWPIESYDVGNPSAFNIQWDKTSNTLMIQSTVLYTYGNLAVRLKGLNTPVMITLTPGQKAVDYRVDMRIPGIGPNGQMLTENALPPATSSDLLNVLDGVPPAGSKLLTVTGGNCQVWLANNKLYVRTRLTVLSPGWDAVLSSADGMHAYEMQSTPMLLVSQHGQIIQLKVEGF